MAQLAEQLICNQQVFGSSPNIGSFFSEGFPSGQRGQTVNLLRNASVVRIHHLPFRIWGLSSAGRASALQAEGHRFEPCRPHLFINKYAGVAELADAQDLKSRG